MTFWTKPLATILQELNSTAAGLTSAEANQRCAKFGPNLIQARHQRPLVVQFLVHFNNPLVIILLIAAAISGFTSDIANFVIILVMVLLSVILEFIQEFRAQGAADRLREAVATRATAVRDGNPAEILASELVPGDVIVLTAGDMVPADGLLLESLDLYVNQALLTGEPYPVEKQSKVMPSADAGVDGATNAVFMGTSVMSGSARMIAVQTGPTTALGAIARTLATKTLPTALEAGTRQFGNLIVRLTMLLVLFVVLVNSLTHKPFLESFMFAVALAVGLTPELLPMIVAVTLSSGALRMARKKVIVKRLSAIHDLGSMDVLCTDKTGTLTEAHIELDRHVDISGKDSTRVLELAFINSKFGTGLKSPLDDAILRHTEVDVSSWKKIGEVPFDFERRRVSVLVESAGKRRLIVKGAPDEVLSCCTACEGADSALLPLDGAMREKLKAQSSQFGSDGFRVLGIASCDLPADKTSISRNDECGLVFSGFAAFVDPPKKSAMIALQALERDGVALKIVSGDSELVTQHLCHELGIPVTGVLVGTDVAAMDDAALIASVERVNLFCRVNPAQKDRVILALRRRGHVVGYLGDGINDAPPLHSADVGISVDSAVDVAREAAALILLEPDLGVLHEGVLEGRRTFANIMKYVMMGTSSNFGNMFSMAGAALFLPFLPMLPVQILLNNLLYDLSEMAIPLDTVDAEYVRRPRHWDTKSIRDFMLVVGPISSIFDFLTFYVMLHVFHAGEALFHTGWFVESMATQTLVIFVIRTAGNPLKSHPRSWLVGTSLGAVAVAALLPFSPFARYLGFVPLPAFFFLILGAMVVCYLILVEFVKRWFGRHFGGELA